MICYTCERYYIRFVLFFSFFGWFVFVLFHLNRIFKYRKHFETICCAVVFFVNFHICLFPSVSQIMFNFTATDTSVASMQDDNLRSIALINFNMKPPRRDHFVETSLAISQLIICRDVRLWAYFAVYYFCNNSSGSEST